jgi:hypothetical protein
MSAATRAAEPVTNRVIVSVTADEYANRWRVGLPAELVIDQRDVEAKLSGIFGLELPGFQFDDHLSELLDLLQISSVQSPHLRV